MDFQCPFFLVKLFRGNRVLIDQEGDTHIHILKIMGYNLSPSNLFGFFCTIGAVAVEKALLWASEFANSPGMNTGVKRSSWPPAASHRQPNACSCSAAAPPVRFSVDGVKVVSSAWKKKKRQNWQYTKLIAFEHWWAACWNQFFVSNKTQRFPVCLIPCDWKPRLHLDRGSTDSF